MARPKEAPITSINLFTSLTERFTALPYNEIEKLRKVVRWGGMMAAPALVRVEMLGRLQHRGVALRSVSAACKLVTRRTDDPGWKEFRTEVVSAVSEAFNNIVLHSYAGRDDGVIEMSIRTGPARIAVELRDWGESFDPATVPLPDLESLPESGLGIYIIRAFTEVEYRAGRPNVLVLSKALENSCQGES